MVSPVQNSVVTGGDLVQVFFFFGGGRMFFADPSTPPPKKKQNLGGTAVDSLSFGTKCWLSTVLSCIDAVYSTIYFTFKRLIWAYFGWVQLSIEIRSSVVRIPLSFAGGLFLPAPVSETRSVL